MGYYTNYELNVIEGGARLIEELRESNDDARYALDVNGETSDSCRWYNHHQDLKEFSKKHPTALFELKGEGEESGDIWKVYFKDGKSQMCRAKIVFDDFDENLLK